MIPSQTNGGWIEKFTIGLLKSFLIKPTPICLNSLVEVPARNALQNVHGGIEKVTNDHNFRDSGNLTLTAGTGQGIGKILIASIGGDDFIGTYTISGTTIDRDTGVRTLADSEVLNITTNTEDTTANDANGIVKTNLATAVMTSKWFDGTLENIVISAQNTAVSQADIYNIAFEQFNDGAAAVHIDTLDLNVLCTDNSGASLSMYLYEVEVSGEIVNITPQVSVVMQTAVNGFTTGNYHRIRRGNLGITLQPSTSGIFVQVAYLGTPAKFADANMKVWARVDLG